MPFSIIEPHRKPERQQKADMWPFWMTFVAGIIAGIGLGIFGTLSVLGY